MEIVDNRTRKVKFGELARGEFFTDGCCFYQKIELVYSSVWKSGANAIFCRTGETWNFDNDSMVERLNVTLEINDAQIS